MANPNKALNTKFQKLVKEVNEAATKPACGPNHEADRKAYNRAMFHLAEFVLRYGDRMQVNPRN